MKRSLALLGLLLLVLGSALPQAAVAQGPVQERAPRPVDQVVAPAGPQQASWTIGPIGTEDDLTRFDGVFVPGPEPWGNKIYFLGGRNGSSTESPNITYFDPVTGLFGDTGSLMVEDVSNYTANLVNDDGTGRGPAIYLIGGYDADGVVANIGTVQRFYPQSGVVEALPAADDWTVLVAGELVTAFGTAVVDDIIYVFGGWENIAAPYFSAGTWAFDPAQPSGSRWTDLGIVLTPARSYIQVAVQNGVIYAMGGIDQYVGGDLVPTTVVEALDTANLAAGWVAKSPLPVASGEGRGFGFDADTLAPAPWDGHIYLAGGGDWNSRSAEAMEYFVATDTWDQGFPDLNQARRDHAGVFVPLCTPDPTDGLPGLWVFGGNIGADAPPYGDPEFYPLECPATTECSVLLVDDDWDFDTVVPNDGGRPYYTSTLDALGQTYDLWDTISLGTPTSADMDPYDVVVWFTGYDWATPISPTEEVELLAYLGAGGNVLLSSQEQNYAFGVTPLMANYFWVDTMTDDVVELDPAGNAADPLFAGLGPYAMARPDQWAAYWPTGGYEGPYDDYANVKAGGFEPLLYNASTEPGSTRYDGGTFRTIYLALPFEWLPDLADRQEVLGAALDFLCPAGPASGMALIPSWQGQDAPIGGDTTYTLTVMNDMGADETFTITYSAAWPISGPATVGPVANGGTADFAVVVSVPSTSNCLDVDLATVQAIAQSDPVYSDTAELETRAMGATSVPVTGTVYDANTGLGLPDAYVELYVGDYVIDYWTWTDAGGVFDFGDIPACNYAGFSSAQAYRPLEFTAAIDPGGPNTVDITLDAAMATLSAISFSVTLPPSTTDTVPLVIGNDGTFNLRWRIAEVPEDSIFPVPLSERPKGVAPQVYADLAASPDGKARFIVTMAQQADLSAAYDIADWSARGHYVLDTLRATAEKSQAGLRAELDRAGAVYQSHYIVNALVVEGDLALVEEIIARPDVAAIEANATFEAPTPVKSEDAPASIEALVWNIAQVNADDAWATFGATGAGIVVASIDTGADYSHPALVEPYRGNTGGVFDHNYNWWDPYYHSTAPYDVYGHGTHTIGTMAGDDAVTLTNNVGMAPDAQWFSCMGLETNTGSGTSAALLECAEFVLAPWDLAGANPNPDLRADIVNNSWGGGQAQFWYNQAVYAWRAAGIFPSFSNGNAGPSCGTAGDPGDMINVISSGATDINDNIGSFSSRGPARVTGILKPNVTAPGVGVISAVPGGGYEAWNGTSMASPHTAGLAALIWSVVPELRGDVLLTTYVIQQSALPITTTQGCGGDGPTDVPNNVYGWGRIDAYEAVSLALSANWDIPWLGLDATNGVVAPGGTDTVNLTLDTTGLTLDTCYLGTLLFGSNDPYTPRVFVPVELCVQEMAPVFTIYLPIVLKGF